jgi:hypothetical protein
MGEAHEIPTGLDDTQQIDQREERERVGDGDSELNDAGDVVSSENDPNSDARR